MKIALAQINTTIGDFDGNVEKIIDYSNQAQREGAELCVFPEQCIPGYPAHDLLERTRFIDQNESALDKLRREIKDIAVIVGFAERRDCEFGKGLYNSAALIENGEILAVVRKSLLPTYDVFDETRYFDASRKIEPVEFKGRLIGVTICEDIWNDSDFWKHRFYDVDPGKELVEKNAELIINVAASPFTITKRQIRTEMLKSFAAKYKKTLLFVNSVGGNDDLVFDGNSLAINGQGQIFASGSNFTEDLIVIDLESDKNEIGYSHLCEEEAALQALIAGTKDYLRKCGFMGALLGLSGGIDSALVAVIGSMALGSDNIEALLMPSVYSSEGSVIDAKQLAENLGMKYHVIPIQDILKSYLKILAPIFGSDNLGVTEENLQARIRGNLLMAFSNYTGRLLLTTGNKSELATGYCTLYGDMAGGFAVISDVPKTLVYRLCRYIDRNEEIIPTAILEKPPSAELRPDQKDSDSLPSYDILDGILDSHIVHGLDFPALVKQGADPSLTEMVLNMVRKNEYKRRQAPPGIKITSKAFGSGRRMPIAQKWIP